MPTTGAKRTSGKKDMAKNHKSRKKAYTDGYRIIKEKAQTGKRSSLQKTWAEGKNNILSVTFAFLFLKIFLETYLKIIVFRLDAQLRR